MEGDDEALRAKPGAVVGKDELKELGLSPREFRETVEKLQAPEHPDFELDLSIMEDADDVAGRMHEAVPDSFE